jgi:hypothetical protein
MGLAEDLNSLPSDPQSPRDKLLQALAMYEEGVAMQRLTLKRQHPDLSDEELEQKLDLWLRREDAP